MNVQYETGEPLYDPDLLKKLDFSKYSSKFSTPISISELGDSFVARPLYSTDYDRGYLQLLSQLTTVGEVSRTQFTDRFAAMKACPNTYYITVIEDTSVNQVIGSATLVVEQKFVHDGGIRGFLEDVVVNDNYRGKQLGKLIVIITSLLAEHVGCYKITLNCKDKLIPFYNSVDYAFETGQSNNSMTLRFSTNKRQSNL